jgi:hypothetical protein
MKDAFSVAFFRWAQAYAHGEVENDFPIVRRFQPCAAAFLVSMQELDHRTKHVLADGLLRRFHTHAVALLGLPPDPEEERVVKWYIDRGRSGFATGEWRRLKAAGIGRRLARPELRTRLLHSIGTALGGRRKDAIPGCVLFETILTGGAVRTHVFLRARGADIAYFQEVFTKDGSRIGTAICPLSWLGIIGGPVSWEEVGEGNVDQAIEAIRVGGLEFLAAVPRLLEASDNQLC